MKPYRTNIDWNIRQAITCLYNKLLDAASSCEVCGRGSLSHYTLQPTVNSMHDLDVWSVLFSIPDGEVFWRLKPWQLITCRKTRGKSIKYMVWRNPRYVNKTSSMTACMRRQYLDEERACE